MRPTHPQSISFLHASRVAVVLFLAIALGTSVHAQIDRAVLEGTVADPSGRVISGASIKILAADTGLTAEQKTNSEGYYRFPGLAVGSYSATVASTGFRTTVIENVILEVGQTHTLDIRLPVGAVTERVEVDAPAQLVDRSSAEAGTVIQPDQIADLADNGRDWTTLSMLAPFAQDDGGGDQRTIRFAGRARDDNNFQIDGVDAGGIQEQAQKSTTRLQISEDAIEEYRVDSALYDVEYGTQAGGQINAETKSGTNDYHGTAFGYLRNSYFDARSFLDFDINGNPAIAPFRMGQYGMSLGGPIVKNKTFFFINYEGIRQLQFNGQQMIVPAGVCCANFPAGEPQGITVPYQKYVLDQAQSLGIGPTMCQIMGALPWRASVGTIDGCTPRFVIPDGAFQWQGSTAAPNPLNNQDLLTVGRQTTIHEDTWLVRIDHKISEKTLLYGRAQRDISLWYSPATNPTVPGDNQSVINYPANYMLALQHTFSPALFNEAKLYVNRSPFHNPGGSALPYSVSTNDFVTLNNTSADIEVGSTYGAIDNLTWVHGRHAFKAGLEIRRVRLNQGQTSNNALTFGDDYSLATATLSQIDYIRPVVLSSAAPDFLYAVFSGRKASRRDSTSFSSVFAELRAASNAVLVSFSRSLTFVWNSETHCFVSFSTNVRTVSMKSEIFLINISSSAPEGVLSPSEEVNFAQSIRNCTSAVSSDMAVAMYRIHAVEMPKKRSNATANAAKPMQT